MPTAVADRMLPPPVHRFALAATLFFSVLFLAPANGSAHPFGEIVMPRSFEEGAGTPASDERWWDGRAESGVAVGIFSGDDAIDGSSTAITPVVEAWFEPEDTWGITLSVPFVYFSASSAAGLDASLTLMGNATMGGYANVLRGRTTVSVGAAVATPTSFLGGSSADPTFEVRALGTAAAMHGFVDVWLWLPEHLALVVPARLVQSLGSGWFLGVSGAAALAIGLGDDDGLSPVGQLSPELGWGGEDARTGVRVSGVVQSDGLADGDSLQLSVEPFFRVDFETAFLTAALTVNLDRPAGFAFDQGRVWGLHVGGGAQL